MVPDEVTLAEDQEKIDAIERRVGIIGEALYQLQRLEVKLPHRDWAINFRNTLIHQYDATLPDTLLRHIRDDLPELREAVEREMDKIEGSPHD